MSRSLAHLEASDGFSNLFRVGQIWFTVLLGRAVIFGHEENDSIQDSPRAGCPCGDGGNGREEPTSQLHTCLEGKAIEEIEDFLE